MEDVVTENVYSTPPHVSETHETNDADTTESAENFQKFMYELFEKNGVINDLRANLRGHIVGILRSARTGDPPACQKHFTQRLELPYQALNMLLAEYLLRLEFNYTLSVFISEIPLANMVLDFAKSLMRGTQCDTGLRFKDEDVWSILNYLGVKCDSEHAANIVEMYREEAETPLLFCMLKCMPLYTPLGLDKGSSQESLLSSAISSDTTCTRSQRTPSQRASSHRASSHCKHFVFCKSCHEKLQRCKERYKKKKQTISKMFEQLKSVYETEMQMAKADEEERVKRSLATHAVHLKKMRVEMEKNFHTRELELTRNVQQKKRFLWGLARLLRDQHQQMSRAMSDVQTETDRLTAKEEKLKSQLAEAEAVLRSRGEEMRRQISDELTILDGRLESLKRERDNINKERSELEHLKHLCDTSAKTTNIETTKEDLRSHYDLLKNEFLALKKYLETARTQPKLLVDQSTITDACTKTDAVLNNGQDLDRRHDDRVKAKQVVNDLKKMKNVNFSQSNLAEIYRERSRSSPSFSTASSEGGDARDATRCESCRPSEETRRLIDENEQLRTFARQQGEHIAELSSAQARLRSELMAGATAPRPRTAPAVLPPQTILNRMPAGATDQMSGQGWRAGAGEEISFLCNAQPRILVPGDNLPFIGLLRDRHNDHRRHLINQWRSLRRRVSPVGALGRSRVAHVPTTFRRERPSSAGPSVRLHSEEDINSRQNQENIEYPSKHSIKRIDDRRERDESPNTVIRDAKLRLRKLEIEAEAVERSYLDFRRKKNAMRGERRATDSEQHENDTETNHDRAPFKKDQSRVESTSRYVPSQTDPSEQIYEDIDEYQARYDIGRTHFKNKNATSSKVRPIPSSSCDTELKIRENRNYLDTSLAEFRKFYHSEKRSLSAFEDPPKIAHLESPHTSNQRPNEYTTPPHISNQRPNEYTTPEHRSSQRPNEYTAPPHTSNQRPNEHTTPPIPRLRKISENNESPKSSRSKGESDKSEPNSINNRIGNDAENPQSPKTKNGTKSVRTDVFKHKKQDQTRELKILKQNINKIYNLPENEESNENFEAGYSTWDKKDQNERNGTIETIAEDSQYEISNDGSKTNDDNNLLRIEVQNVSQLEDVKLTNTHAQDLLLVVERSNAGETSEINFQEEIMSTQMTILISPKRNTEETTPVEDSKGKTVKLSENDILNALYRADGNEIVSSVNMPLDGSKDVLVHFLSDNEEYPEDFSVEVISPKYETDPEHSPISLAKTSEDENFWDS